MTLTTGETLQLAPDVPELASRDGRYVRLAWGSAIDFGFVLPAQIRAADVVSSKLVITGFYRPYGKLVMAARQRVQSPIRRAAGGEPKALGRVSLLSTTSGRACPLPFGVVPR